VANRAGILHQLPAFLASLHTMENAGGVADALVIVTLDEAAGQLGHDGFECASVVALISTQPIAQTKFNLRC
jgi:hypothetical protein